MELRTQCFDYGDLQQLYAVCILALLYSITWKHIPQKIFIVFQNLIDMELSSLSAFSIILLYIMTYIFTGLLRLQKVPLIIAKCSTMFELNLILNPRHS